MTSRNRTTLAVAVTALVLTGTVAGTTLALWHDTAAASSSSVSSATISVTVNGSTNASITGPTNLLPATAQLATATLRNDSTAAPNLRMQVFLDKVTVTGTNLDGNIEVAASTAASAGACTVASSGYQTPTGATGANLGQVTTTSLPAQTSTTLCLSVRLKSAAPAGARAQSGSLALTVRGQQVRP